MAGPTPIREDLENALKEGHKARVASLIQNHSDLLTSKSLPWLHLAVSAPKNSSKLLRLLLKEGISADVTDSSGATALHLSAKKGQKRCLENLLEWKAKIECKDNLGRTPLHYAALCKHKGVVACIQVLLEAGAFLDASNKKGLAPLHVAAEVDNVTAARIFLHAGASQNMVDGRGRTPIHIASSIKMTEILVLAGADMTTEDAEGQTPLYKAISHFPSLVHTMLTSGVAVRGDPCDSQLGVYFNFNVICRPGNVEVKLLNALAHDDHFDRLKHPLCETFLHLKWLLIRTLFCIKWAMFAFVVFALTINVCLRVHLPLPQDCNTSTYTVWVNNKCSYIKTAAVLRWLSLLMMSAIVMRTLLQISVKKSLFLRRKDKWLEMVFIVCSIPLLVTEGRLEMWERQLGSFTLLLGWYGVTMMVGHIPSVGIYVQMFHAVALKMMKFSAVFLSLFVGFAVSFHLSFVEVVAFRTAWSSFIKTLVMMVGELDTAELFETSDSDQKIWVLPELIFIIFVLLITVIITNLLVGLAVQDIQELQKVAGVSRLAHTVEQEASFDYFLSSRLLECPFSANFLTWMKKRYSLLQQFPPIPLHEPSLKRLSSVWLSNQESEYKTFGHMDHYNVVIFPYDPTNPGRVYKYQQTTRKMVPTSYSLPSWIIRNTKKLIENNPNIGYRDADFIYGCDSDWDSSSDDSE
ncbi:transient receptor potential channel pyrexia-like isoform X1 [Homarus americanus]|uniref:Transient receptor potential cation channel pyrexia n=1 Tax=Homarus americanus TaxID=6706 RepID=A0A1L3INV9_HOMAM|nr:transient receptor potential channel pyrexia-like isoform X1 [Homarus americanus]APG53786.1 transient receptor potential cation channel pyrexia [Homarus americanus]KAG7154455.1 Transient receptor potential channel pyrexia-like 5 [Homarus americanus]